MTVSITHQTITTRIIIKTMIEKITSTKLKTSFSKVVNSVLGSLVILAMQPNTVLSPALITTPIPLLEMQWVPYT